MFRRFFARTPTARRLCLSVAAVAVTLVTSPAAVHAVSTDESTTAVTLAADNPYPANGQNVTLTATTDFDVASQGYALQIWADPGTPTPLGTCYSGKTCSWVQAAPPDFTQITYVASVGPYRSSWSDGDTTQPFLVSNHVTVYWQIARPVPSDMCTSPTANLVEGYVGPAYVRLQIEDSAGLALVCYRITSGGLYTMGGALVFESLPVVVSLVTVDSQYQWCSQASGNILPGPHPLAQGPIVGEAFQVDAWANASSAALCLQAGGVQQRVVVQPSESGPGAVLLLQDEAAQSPAPAGSLASYPSSTCRNASGSVQVLDAQSAGETAQAYTWQASGTQLDACVRLFGVVSAGGLLALAIPSTPSLPNPGVTPTVSTSSNTSACSFVILSLTSPAVAELATSSPPGTNPSTICIDGGGQQASLTIGATVSPTIPPPPSLAVVTFTPDPDTP